MRKLITLTCLLLIAFYPYSQSTYPKRVKIDNDTVNLFTDGQVRIITQTFISEEFLLQEVEEYKKIVFHYDTLLLLYDRSIDNYKGMIATKEETISIKDKEIKAYQEMIKQERRSKIKGIITGVVTGFAIGVLTVILL